MSQSDSCVHAAYAHCMAITRKHYENFPVASLFLSASRRNALAAIYAFARIADDFADEPGPLFPTSESRLEALADWRRRLNACYADETSDHPIFIALGDAARRFGLTRDYFDRLIRAFEMDVRANRHQDFASLLNYCDGSANPVGRLMLELHDYRESGMLMLSDALCTALQLANFWQDAGVDLDRDRIYLPLDDLKQFGLTVQDLVELRDGRNREKMERFQSLIRLEVGRTADLFKRAQSLPEQVSLGLRLQLRMTWRGGVTILRKMRRMNFMVLSARPALRKLDALAILLKSLRQGSIFQS
ncbi:MAG: squalene synthase HpnC [Terriglobia bacterium]